MNELRSVTVFEHYRESEDSGKGYKRNIVKTREIGQGRFHGFGLEYEELEMGVGAFTVAIVEMLDGTVVTPLPTLIRFDD